MAEENILPMRAEFSRWYRTVDVGENRSRLDARWTGVSSLVQAADPKSVETMLAVLLRTKSRPDAKAMNSLRNHFKGADDLFEMSGNDRELEILCGAALATMLEGDGPAAAQAALATTVAFFAGARNADFPVDLATAAEVAIARISDERRVRPNVSPVTNIGHVGLDKETLEKLKAGPNAENVPGAFDVTAKSVNAVISDMIGKVNAAIGEVENFIAIQDEELQLLWWLFGARSKTLDCPFAEVPADAQPIVWAAEVAEATQFEPGPASVKPILSRAGLKERKKTAVVVAVNACERDFLGKLVKDVEPSPVTRPLHFAIHRKLEVGNDTSWAANWSAVTGIDADFAVAGIDLGNLFYRERLGLRFGS
jgi:hypothetical protein